MLDEEGVISYSQVVEVKTPLSELSLRVEIWTNPIITEAVNWDFVQNP
ncbi:hypothetical protein N9933_02930 [bacterium]|nr:hypothetical protein [bacterium]